MKRQRCDDYTGPFTDGIDVSHWQGQIDWGQVASEAPSVRFAIVRVGDGKDVDRRFAENYREVQRVGIRRGTYQYFRADRGGVFQADLLLREMEAAGGFADGDLPPCIDWEGGSDKNLRGGLLDGDDDIPIEVVAEEALRWLDRIEQALGCVPLLYTGQAFHWLISQARPDLAPAFARYPLWIAGGRTKALMPVDKRGRGFPWETWTIHQHSARGSVPGIEGNVDLDRFRGDGDAFAAWPAPAVLDVCCCPCHD